MSRSGARVLLIDGHEASRIATVFSLKLHGHVCAHVPTERDAYDVIRWFRPTVIIFDIAAGGAARRLSETATEAGVRAMLIAISTQDAMPDVIDESIVDGFLTKPLDIGEIDRLVRRGLR